MMKMIKVSMELGFGNLEDSIDFSNKEDIAYYLTNILYENPEFFGGFTAINIESIREVNS